MEVDDMRFGFIPGRGATDALFIVRRMHEEYRKKDKKLYMCFVNLEKAFDRVSREAPMGTKEERTTKDLGESSDEFE